MTAIIDSFEEITPEWMTGALGAGTVTAVETEVMSVGQLGFVARVTLTHDDDTSDAPATVMVKLPREDPGSRQIGVGLGTYEAEVRFYREVAPTVSVKTPQLYWGDVESSTGRFTLVMEDLASHGEPGDMIAGGTVDQAAAALEALVALQAPRWNESALHDLPWLAAPERSQIMFAGVAPGFPPFAERFGDLLPADDIALVERVVPHANAWAARMTTGTTVVVHGDFRMDNVIYPAGGDQPVAVFDWQAARVGLPLIDACVYLGGCLSLEDRRAHDRDLLREYHAGLQAAGVAGFSFDDVWEAYRWGVFYGLFLSVPFSIQLDRTERGDQLFAGMVRAYTQLARDLESEQLLG